MADGTVFEQQGVPAAAIITRPFASTADAMARRNGFPGYRYATMAHPISSLGPEEIRQRAREVLPQVLELLGIQAGVADPAAQPKRHAVGKGAAAGACGAGSTGQVDAPD